MSKVSCFPFGNPTNKTQTGTAYTWGSTNSKPPGPIIVIDQSEILSRSHVQFITLSLGGAQLCCAIYQPLQAARIWCRKPISWAKPEHFNFFTINCSVWSHIPSTIGDAVSHFTSLVVVGFISLNSPPQVVRTLLKCQIHGYWFNYNFQKHNMRWNSFQIIYGLSNFEIDLIFLYHHIIFN
jgi:hypothetical protein